MTFTQILAAAPAYQAPWYEPAGGAVVIVVVLLYLIKSRGAAPTLRLAGRASLIAVAVALAVAALVWVGAYIVVAIIALQFGLLPFANLYSRHRR